MKIRILKNLFRLKKVYKEGSVLEIKDDGNGVPLDKYWRNRIKDSPIDNCVEIIKSNKKIRNKDE